MAGMGKTGGRDRQAGAGQKRLFAGLESPSHTSHTRLLQLLGDGQNWMNLEVCVVDIHDVAWPPSASRGSHPKVTARHAIPAPPRKTRHLSIIELSRGHFLSLSRL